MTPEAMRALTADPGDGSALIERLGALCEGRGLGPLSARIRSLGMLSGQDLAAVEEGLAALPRCGGLVVRSAGHLLDLGGKRLRPLCVALAARAGAGFGPAARDLAIAVELVHSATLLHDDVVDLGETRRGAATARAVYGNAASIFAGDWLLVEALRRVRQAEVPGTLERLLAVIHEMILAESIQLEGRGRFRPERALYLAVVEGKTASLFGWALEAGGGAGGLAEVDRRALERYGRRLGVAFQAVDDLLDLTGSAASTGKALFADLREGKMTAPLLFALERRPSLGQRIEKALAGSAEQSISERAATEITEAVVAAGGVDECRRFARAQAAEAISALASLPRSDARDALETVAAAAVERSG